MTAQKKISVTVETERVLIIRRRRTTRKWCRECGCEVDMVGLDEARLLGKADLQLVDAEGYQGWHFNEEKDGKRLICLPSLLKSM